MDSPSPAGDCLFCRIVAGDVPATVVHEGARAVAIRDIAPQAPTHVLVVSREHYPDLAAVLAVEPDLAAELLAVSVEVAESEGLVIDGYRLVVNTGDAGGQTVPHVHVHLVGGRRMGWPPG